MDQLETLYKNKKYLKHALTHKSYLNEHTSVTGSNERLEFLGDAILEYVISKELFSKFPNKEEGYLTALRANLVNTSNLASVAKNLKLGSAILLSKGEEEGGGRKNSTLLANTVEAIIGSLFLDSGLDKVEKFIIKNILFDLSSKVNQPLKDAKSRLQEIAQAKGESTPVYKVIKESGPDHAKEFTLEVLVNKKAIAKGKGKSKSEAEQQAAEKALRKYL